MDGTSRGSFITFEGSEGCGKTTQIRLLVQRMEAEGRRVEQFREPGGTVLGEQIRTLLQHTPEVADMVPEAELCLFAASRCQLVREKILPALAGGWDVVADRFFDSTTVYQGFGRGLPIDLVNAVNGLAVGQARPDITIVLDMDSREAFDRVMRRGGERDRMEQLPPDFYETVRQGFLSLAAADRERMQVVDASLPAEQVAAIVWQKVSACLSPGLLDASHRPGRGRGRGRGDSDGRGAS